MREGESAYQKIKKCYLCFFIFAYNILIFKCSNENKVINLNERVCYSNDYHATRPPSFHLAQAHSKVSFVRSHDCYSNPQASQDYDDATC